MIKFKHFLTKEAFNATAKNNDDIIFIDDTKEIWTHGLFFPSLEDYVKFTDAATTTKDGLMSSIDKIKLDNIDNKLVKTIKYSDLDNTIESGFYNIFNLSGGDFVGLLVVNHNEAPLINVIELIIYNINGTIRNRVKDNGGEGDWYLPALGELIYIFPFIILHIKAANNINTIIKNSLFSSTLTLNRYWSSTSYSNYRAFQLIEDMINSNDKNNSYTNALVLAFRPVQETNS